jgi:hypothetical protein
MDKGLSISVLLTIVENVKSSIDELNNLTEEQLKSQSLDVLTKAVGSLNLLQNESKEIQTQLLRFASMLQVYVDNKKDLTSVTKTTSSKKTFC